MKSFLTAATIFGLTLTTALIDIPGAQAEDLDQIQLRQGVKRGKLGFGFLGVLDTTFGVNEERSEITNVLTVAPQLKMGDKMRLRLNMYVAHAWLDRQENPWDTLYDWSLQFNHLGFYQERHTGISFAGTARYYFPTSKASRNASSYGQFRAIGKASRTFLDRLYFAFEFNAQKYFNKYTTWDTAEDPGSSAWFHSGGYDDYLEVNTSYGVGETFTGTVTTLPGLDLSLIFGLYQSRHYQPDENHSDIAGSSYLNEPRYTVWSHSFRFGLDATYSLAALPWVKMYHCLKRSIISKTMVSIGYDNYAPQLDTRERNINPFKPKYGSVYFDIIVLY